MKKILIFIISILSLASCSRNCYDYAIEVEYKVGENKAVIIDTISTECPPFLEYNNYDGEGNGFLGIVRASGGVKIHIPIVETTFPIEIIKFERKKVDTYLVKPISGKRIE